MLNHGVHHLPEKTIKEKKLNIQYERSLTQSPGIVACSLIDSQSSWYTLKEDSAEDWDQFQLFLLPVDPTRTFIRLDVHLVQIDVNLGDFHLEAVGQKLDGLPDGAIARSPWQREKGLGSSGSCNDNMPRLNKLNKQHDESHCGIFSVHKLLERIIIKLTDAHLNMLVCYEVSLKNEM